MLRNDNAFLQYQSYLIDKNYAKLRAMLLEYCPNVDSNFINALSDGKLKEISINANYMSDVCNALSSLYTAYKNNSGGNAQSGAVAKDALSLVCPNVPKDFIYTLPDAQAIELNAQSGANKEFVCQTLLQLYSNAISSYKKANSKRNYFTRRNIVGTYSGA